MTDSYVDQLTLELRRRDVPGIRIGEVIAEIEAHIAESGDSPLDAFGPPPQYAATVAAALGPPVQEVPRWLRFARLYAVGLGAMLVTRFVLVALGLLGPELSVGTLIAAAVLPLSATVVVAWLTRSQPRSRWATGIMVLAAVAAPVVAGALLQYRMVPDFPRWVTLLVGLVLLALGLHGVRADRVVDPRDGSNRYPLPRRAGATLVLIPVLAVAGAVLVGLLLR
jgi:hypothetical protein